MAIPKIEEMLGKTPLEIPFCKDSNAMIEFIDSLSFIFCALPGTNQNNIRRALYKRMEEHYRDLAAIAGANETFIKMADYCAEQARKCQA